MALVKVISNNFFAGADLNKLEVGARLSVSEENATAWIKAGLVELIEEQAFEVASPSKTKRVKSDGDNTD
ncbi:hypothetical protein Xbed_03776 [Xenorhabdus beddingii]|uniref:Uncharacterized protein n=1 Tax=Xenorhabdus beddingii TaxID=40578 RepID=A0A1Y2S754_9GAMM|nr:hypothetical protein [Xenorhabdus beddingii]OTA13973.1 hypothetical protein Xbed_03776 [Xenorhabdus beddingii]